MRRYVKEDACGELYTLENRAEPYNPPLGARTYIGDRYQQGVGRSMLTVNAVGSRYFVARDQIRARFLLRCHILSTVVQAESMAGVVRYGFWRRKSLGRR